MSSDPFTVLGLPRRLQLDDAEVARKGRDLLRELHPDRFFVQGPAAVAEAERQSSAVNDAVRQLRDLPRRAALVSGFGDDDGKADRPPQALLAQVFAWNERIDEGHSAELAPEVQAAKAAAMHKLERAAANWDEAALAGAATSTHDRALRDALGELRYLDALLQRLGTEMS